MKRPAVFLLTLIAVGAIVWVTVFGASGSRPRRKEPRKGQRTVQPKKKKIRIAGHVQTREGKPVEGATVFVLPKKRRGSNRDKADHEVTDAEGRWALWTRRTVGCWIGVVAAGYRNAYLDGDTVDPAVQMFLVVEPAPAITVELTDAAGKPLRGVGVQAVPWPDSGAFYYLPGPRGRQGEQWRVTNNAGLAVFRRGDGGPVTIAADVPGRHTVPGTAWLPAGEGVAALRAHPNASVELLLRHDTGAPYAGFATAEFLDVGTGRSVFALSEQTQKPGRLLLEAAVAPGRYHVLVRPEDAAFGAVIVPEVDVARAQPPQTVRVELGPVYEHGGVGTLAVQLRGNASKPRPGTRRRAPLAFVRRAGPDWERVGWVAAAPVSWDPSEDLLRFELEPGRYHLLVADVATGRAALEHDVAVADGSLRKLDVAMRPGQRGRLPPLAAAGVFARSLSVDSDRWTRLPVYGSTHDGSLRAARALDVIGRSLAGTELWLGPYPFDAFTLTLERSDGSKASETFR